MLLGKAILVAFVLITGLYMVRLLATEIDLGVATVIDGDTIEIGGRRIRLFGIDAPESSQLCIFNGKPWPCGRRAAAALATYIGASTVRCRPTGGHSYHRVVARCFKGVDDDLARYQVQQGWALDWQAYSLEYVQEEREARDALRGVWSSTFVPPWQYRAEHASRPHRTNPPEPQ